MALIGAGIAALAISLLQYHWGVRYLWSCPYLSIAGAREHETPTPTIAVAVLLMLIGALAFGAILIRAV